MNKYGQEIPTLNDWADVAFRNGDYEEADFLNEAIEDWDAEVKDANERYYEMEIRADELAVGMSHILNLVIEMKESIQKSPRLNRKEILAWVKEIEQEFEEYI